MLVCVLNKSRLCAFRTVRLLPIQGCLVKTHWLTVLCCVYMLCVFWLSFVACSCRTRRCCAWRRCSSRSSSSTRPAAWRHCKLHCCSIHGKKILWNGHLTSISHAHIARISLSRFIPRTYLTYISHVIISMSCCQSGLQSRELLPATSSSCCRKCGKRLLLRHFYVKTISLPRQARDKHRENSKKRCVYIYI